MPDLPQNTQSGDISPDLRIEASPTKEFFIFMITRDIDLTRAIADLVDNSVDGAKRLRGEGTYEGLSVRINLSSAEFKIADDCGGIAVDIARKYAFRFGRAKGMPNTPHSIGQFGVGMKRALFKIGNTFEVESSTEQSHFIVRENLEDWARRPEWDFSFKELQENVEQSSVGTKITVTDLFTGIAEEFALTNFETRLRSALAAAHQQSLSRGLHILVNGVPLTFSAASVLSSNQIVPVEKKMQLGANGDRVDVRILAGVGESDPPKAGWNVFCNGRLILDADKTRVTGWGDSNPHYHNEYARFRGFVFFDSDNAALLPWNTTKSAVDEDSPSYRGVRLEMIQIMAPIIRYLAQIAKEKKQQQNDDPTPSEIPLQKAQPTGIYNVKSADVFRAPVPRTEVARPSTERISYEKPKTEIQKLKTKLNVRTAKEVGEKTFDYYVRMEGE
jgi:hypothetical protein